ncbi:MAG: hypothetical protein K6T55_09080 [Syntrophobacterales bacterium]|nr:hypothetical protein [Syntrophobacterales bacterium]
MWGDNLAVLPQTQAVIQGLTEELANRRSLVVLLPRPLDGRWIWDLVRRELIRRDFWVEEIPLTEWRGEEDLRRFLWQRLQWAGEPAAGARPDSPPLYSPTLIISLTEADGLPEEKLDSLLETLRWWAGKSHAGEPPMSHTALCLMGRWASLGSAVPQTDVRLAVHQWRGVPTALEVQLWCRLAQGGQEPDPASRWREHLLPALCGPDWRLAEYLWDKVHLGVKELMSHLTAYARDLGWSREYLEKLNLNLFLHTQMDPSFLATQKEFWPLWSEGLLHRTPEYGEELHSAALAVLGREDLISHRVWRGQVQFLLPLINQIRLAMVSQIAIRHGPDWPLRWDRPPDDREYEALKANPLDVQWGYVYYCIHKFHQLNSFKQWLPLAESAKNLRNELAHYRPVEFYHFKNFWNRAHNFLKSIS